MGRGWPCAHRWALRPRGPAHRSGLGDSPSRGGPPRARPPGDASLPTSIPSWRGPWVHETPGSASPGPAPCPPGAALALTLLHHLQQTLLDELLTTLPAGHLLLQSCTHTDRGVRQAGRGPAGRGHSEAAGAAGLGAPGPRGGGPRLSHGAARPGPHTRRGRRKLAELTFKTTVPVIPVKGSALHDTPSGPAPAAICTPAACS